MGIMNVDDDGGFNQHTTTVTMLHEETQTTGIIFVDSYSPHGFRLTTGIRLLGPCAIFPRSFLSWNVSGVEGITKESLSLFTVLEPKIDILVIGVGTQEDTRKIDPAVISYLKQRKIQVEILNTDAALSTFNFLNSEKRYVAGAFIPPSYVKMDSDSAGLNTGDRNQILGTIEQDYLLEDEMVSPEEGDFPQSKIRKEAWERLKNMNKKRQQTKGGVDQDYTKAKGKEEVNKYHE